MATTGKVDLAVEPFRQVGAQRQVHGRVDWRREGPPLETAARANLRPRAASANLLWKVSAGEGAVKLRARSRRCVV